MKRLLLLRHAKSSWKDALPDHDRPLKKRGQRDAPLMGKRLAEQGELPELIVSSTAIRARDTALAFAEASRYAGEIRFEAKIYEAEASTLLSVIRALPDGAKSAMIVGHNPGLEDLVATLTAKQERMTTAALAEIELPIAQWMLAVAKPMGKLHWVWRPKELFGPFEE